MKRLILTLIAALALPTSVNAESYWLVLSYVPQGGVVTIEMESMESCELTGKEFKTSDDWSGENARFAKISGSKKLRSYFCVKGK